MSNTAKLKEKVAVSDVATWVSVADYRQVSVFCSETGATLQLRQATDASGTGAKDLGTGVAAAAITELTEQCDAAGGFVYVSATVTGGTTPEAVLIRSHSRFNTPG